MLSPFVSISPKTATIIYFLAVAFILLKENMALDWVQLAIVALFVLALGFLGSASKEVFEWTNVFQPANFDNILLPYGVLLFSFWGLALIPEIVVENKRKWSPIVWTIGLTFLTALICYAAFSLVIIGISGTGTSQEAVLGIKDKVSQNAYWMAAFFGFLTTFSSYIAFGHTVRRTFAIDFKIPKIFSWLAATIVPFILYLIGLQHFVLVMGITGAVFSGTEGLLIILTYWASKPRKTRKMLLASIVVLLLVGVVAEVIHVLSGGG